MGVLDLDVIDQALSQTGFLLGDALTAVDLAIFWCLHPYMEDHLNLEHELQQENRQNVGRWLNAVQHSTP